MKNKSLYVYILIGVIVLIIAVLGYLYNPYSMNLTPISSTTPSYNVLDLFDQIDAIKLDTSIFSDPRFSALTDITIRVINGPVGRTNPFAALQ